MRLEVREAGADRGTVHTPEAVRYFHRCGRLQEELMLGYHCRFADYASPNLLHARVPVEPGLAYEYRVLDGGSASAWRNLRAPPPPGAEQVRLAIVGDLGQTPDARLTCRQIRAAHARKPIDLAVFTGDVAYSDGNGTVWDEFMRMIDAEGCAEFPWLVLPGNHDMEPDDISEEPFLPLRARWRTPEVRRESLVEVGNYSAGQRLPGPGQVGAFHVRGPEAVSEYDFGVRYDYGGSFFAARAGPAHLLALNPYTDSRPGSAQAAWLEEELGRVDRGATPFLFTFTHAAWHHSNHHHRPGSEVMTNRLQDMAEPRLVKARADAVFGGHVHAYERSHPISGITHFLVGNGGNREELSAHFFTEGENAERSAATDGTHYGFGILEMDRGRAHWTEHRSTDGAVLDEMVLAPNVRARGILEQPPPGELLVGDTGRPEAFGMQEEQE